MRQKLQLKISKYTKHHTVAGSYNLPRLSRTSGTLSYRYVVTHCLIQPNNADGRICGPTISGGNRKLNPCANFSCKVFLLINVKILLPPRVYINPLQRDIVDSVSTILCSFSSLLLGLGHCWLRVSAPIFSLSNQTETVGK